MPRVTQSPLYCRPIWPGSVGSDFDCRAADPSGITNKSQMKNRPAVMILAASAGILVYQQSNDTITRVNLAVGIPVAIDAKKILATGTVAYADTTAASVTSTAHTLSVFWGE